MPTESLLLLIQVYYACDIAHITNMIRCKILFHWDKGIFTLLHTHVGQEKWKKEKSQHTFKLILAPIHKSLTKTASRILAESLAAALLKQAHLGHGGLKKRSSISVPCSKDYSYSLLSTSWEPTTDKWSKLTVLTLGAQFVRKHPFNLQGLNGLRMQMVLKNKI